MLRRLQDRPLSQQLIAPMLLVGGICLLAAVYSAFMLQDSVGELGRVYSSSDRRLQVIDNIESGVTSTRSLSLRHLASESYQAMQEIHAELDAVARSLHQNLDEVSGAGYSDEPEFIEGSMRLSASVRAYLGQIREIMKLSEDFEKESAFIKLTASDNNHLPPVTENLREMKRSALENVTQLRRQLADEAKWNLKSTIAFGIAGVGLLTLISWLVMRRVTLRISHLLQWTGEASSGNLSAPLLVDSGDEVGNLTRSMKEMAHSIRQAHDALREAKQDAERSADELRLYANAFDSSGEAMLITDKNNHIIDVNAAFTRQTGYVPDEVMGKDPKILASGETPTGVYREMWRDLSEISFWQGELWDRKRNGEIYPKWIRISAIRSETGEVLFYIASFTDISARKEAEARIEHLAHHDILTGLHNRFSMEVRLEQVIASARREQQRIGLLFIDLDRFKNINDSLGHQIGDKLLIEVAGRLKTCVRDSDIVARIGGDEFVVVLVGIKDNSHAAVVAENILQNVSRQYEVDGHAINTSPSIGISIYPDDGVIVDDLMKAADVAMYHAKEHGRSSYHYFNEAMLVTASERLRIERELRIAVHNNQLELHYQPQVRAGDGHIVAMEALVRWNHPQDGLIYPDQFIAIAEESGIIFDLGRWVIDAVCRQLVAWHALGHGDFKIALNLSARQLQSETLSDEIGAILKQYQLDGEHLEIEVTETAAMSDPAVAVAQLNALRAQGISIAIDDFGTGYSSLSYLKRLPINTLKLDRSFVRDIESDENDAEICSATVALAHNLGLKIVAEGVENEAQRDFLVKLNCDYLQGYFYSRPLPAGEITQLLHNMRAAGPSGSQVL
jgi:diguanylate cyclase (GGDEF)-like protein/PAS domain S-box-containing protein